MKLPFTKFALWASAFAAAVLIVLSTPGADAAVFFTSTVGAVELRSGDLTKTFEVSYPSFSGSLYATSLDFRVRIGDGSGSPGTPPKITAVDLFSGTIFVAETGYELVAYETGYYQQSYGIIDEDDTFVAIPASSTYTLATITFDISGCSPGTWDLELAVGAFYPCTYGTFDGSNNDDVYVWGGTEYVTPLGTIEIVPEPAWTGMCAGLGLLAFGWVRSRLNKRLPNP